MTSSPSTAEESVQQTSVNISSGANDHPTSSSQLDQPADENPKLSKNAQKKLAKAERYAQYKIERRAREKEAKREKKRLLAEKRAAGELDEAEEELARQKKKAKIQPLNFHGRVIVDLGFDNLMSEKETISLCSQLAYTYSANRRASYPFSLIFTSLDGKTFNRLEGMSDAGYKRWTRTEWWQEGYEQLWSKPPSSALSSSKLEEAANVQPLAGTPSISSEHLATYDEAIKGSVIYLTADSEEELTELKENETYIIGGICDHNRYKNLCLNKAKESGIRTARLPIGRYLASLPTRKVLTVNQVFEILLKWVETKNWEESLYSVVPKRKFQAGKDGTASRSEIEDAERGGKSRDGAEDNGEVIIDVEELAGVIEGGEEGVDDLKRDGSTNNQGKGEEKGDSG